MIRRLQSGGVTESLARRTVAGGMPAPVEAAPPPLATTEDIDAIAYRTGYAEGFEAGEHDGLRELEQRKLALEAEAREALRMELEMLGEREHQLEVLAEGLAHALREHEQAMQELAFELALRTLSQVFSASPDDHSLLERLCERMAHEHRSKALRLAVSPADRTLLPERIDGLDIVESHTLAPGSCRVVTERGETESAIATRLAAIYESMLETLGVRG